MSALDVTTSEPEVLHESEGGQTPLCKECKKCHVVKFLHEYHPQAKGKYGYTARCKVCRNKEASVMGKIYYANRKRDHVEKGLCISCGEKRVSKFYCREHLIKRAENLRVNRKRHSEKYKLWRRLKHVQRREEVLQAYGGRCACCGEPWWEFLSIDHINNDGYKHRKEIGTTYMYDWLKRHGFPKDNFQLLCMNCQWSKRRGKGICVHKRGKDHECS